MEYRMEHDSMGEVRVPADKYWGAQTERSHNNFPIGVSIETMPAEIIHAFGILKKAAARANRALRPEKMTEEKLAAIEQAADEVISGQLLDNDEIQDTVLAYQSSSSPYIRQEYYSSLLKDITMLTMANSDVSLLYLYDNEDEDFIFSSFPVHSIHCGKFINRCIFYCIHRDKMSHESLTSFFSNAVYIIKY